MTTAWDPAAATLRTALRGRATIADVAAWQDGLERALADLPAGLTVKLLVDLTGYQPADLDAHRAMRVVVPRLLAAHGLRPAVLDLFEDAPPLPVAPDPPVRIGALANVHHDRAKMAEYDRRLGRAEQSFFADRAAAERWLDERPPRSMGRAITP